MPPSLRNYVDLNIVSVSAKFDLGMIKFLFKTGEEEQGNISGILLQHYQKNCREAFNGSNSSAA